ncbi:methylamine utilization protein [Pseudomonas gingeri NCPPB 3146 = LMG 5327]|uniref:Methylamine utilization protein n=2 Tax=Pseudomonas gingeri TaxID=117681 RepID=A0A7Y7Y5Y5_9PSED|nr:MULTISPECIES: methylamine utilization protein [Pseudomonas]NWA07999.1 methylamine utilization protein [Pseudomonas gingeri]NWC17242.1 methylamine utilization protein [Pseudomonas gingeri]NWE44712.1 methylamine utilization protein [Pseudomonas gingeri]NWE67601.1 methylamine utilization protein [Pseudomonas gingeri]PNQ91266.1 methylamine utilization protein [Pseudomonas gingeri NCPPB 3146 = LMG 5327]
MARPTSLLGLFLCVAGLLSSGLSQAAGFQAEMVDQQGKPLVGAVVTLQGNATAATYPLKADMDQRDKQFAPHVLAVHTGTQIRFPNSDNIRHQVYSFSQPKRFELRLYEGTPSDPVLFDKPGIVVLGCNIHDWMLGYVYVTDEPWFAVSDEKGRIAFDKLPAGHYRVTLWHPQVTDMQPQPGGEIEVPATGLKQRLSLTIQPLSPDAPSAPAPSAFGDAFNKALSETAQ